MAVINQMSIFSDWNRMLGRVMQIGRRLQFGDEQREQDEAADLLELCELLLSDRGEATGLAIAQRILDEFERLDAAAQDGLFTQIAGRFDVDEVSFKATLSQWQAGEITARQLHFACEPRSQELFRRLNRIPGGTSKLVGLRAVLLDSLKRGVPVRGLDQDLQHLFSSWFNRGFLALRRIDWSTSAEVLEKIIAHEAVHEIKGWRDLQRRVAAPDRRLYAFFHPALPVEPLIFVEVALTQAVPDAIAPILASEREFLDPVEAKTAVFYSISNCQKGLRGISFGNFLIKQVVEKLKQELTQLEQFVTLSPVPGFRHWLERVSQQEEGSLPDGIRALLPDNTAQQEPAAKNLSVLAAWYLLRVKRDGQRTAVADPVAHFHLGNGASLHQVHQNADFSGNGQRRSWGIMVNYLYDQASIETNHENYINQQQASASDAVQALLKGY